MKHLFLGSIIVLLSAPISLFASVDDTSVIDALTQQNTQELSQDIKLKTVESCEVFEDVLEDYFKMYWKNNYKSGFFQYRDFEMSVESPQDMGGMLDAVQNESKAESAFSSSSGGGDFSETNIQVAGVDESDIIKTDGTYLYYYNETEKAVFIVNTKKDVNNPVILKKIQLPENFYNPVLYISENRLIILASGYSNLDYSKQGYYINRNSKTYTVVFDTTKKSDPELMKLYSSDGDYKESRKIGDIVYVISSNYFNYPYYGIKSEDDIQIDIKKMLPQKLDISKTTTENKKNLNIGGQDLSYNVTSGSVTDCQNISYSFPDEETLKNTSFNPGYNIISSINITDTEQKVETKVIAGNNNEVHMSLDNLYMTEAIYSPNNYSCPRGAMCAMPFFWGGTQNTLIHKLNINGAKLQYQDTAMIPGSPLNQYSMDEYEGNFRIVTSQWQPELSTGLYILDKNLKNVSKLTNLAPGETFQSSRFIGDKLFLVTFEQIDPLFAIDISDVKKPTVLGELKIPGYSTYLHPYDENHLIGLGYDTTQNQWGGTQTAGVKVDLYKINYDKKCGDSNLTAEQNKKCASGDYKGIIVEQKYTKTLGGNGSSSEALSNPRMFIWNPNKKTLLLPATLYERDNNYVTTDYYNGLFALKIDAEKGIELIGKTTQIDMTGIQEEREQECLGYTEYSTEPVCRELLNGEVICDTPQRNSYVPNYCYKDATIWQYIGDKSWEYQDMNIKRTLYIDEKVYGFSDTELGTYNWDLQEKSTTPFTK